MSEHQGSQEFTGTSVEEAIEKGLKSLGVSREEADIQIIEEGTRGIFGLGSRDAVVRITPLQAAAPASEQDEVVIPEPVFFDKADEIDYEDDEDDEDDEDYDDDYEDEDDEDEMGEPDDGDEQLYDEDHIVAITRDTVVELLQKMHIAADVSAQMTPRDPFSRRSAVAVDITGEDLSILIGRKAETLDALQYITRLIVGKELSRSIIINIDVQGYKKRKEQRLRRIAQSVARQAVETGRRQYLEPMPPWDRRIVHMELRNNPDVYTESVGEGSRRKITINPKNS